MDMLNTLLRELDSDFVDSLALWNLDDRTLALEMIGRRPL